MLLLIPMKTKCTKYNFINRVQKLQIIIDGDAIEENENLLLKKYHLPLIDVLKVGHHGSKTSSSKTFFRNHTT